MFKYIHMFITPLYKKSITRLYITLPNANTLIWAAIETGLIK